MFNKQHKIAEKNNDKVSTRPVQEPELLSPLRSLSRQVFVINYSTLSNKENTKCSKTPNRRKPKNHEVWL